MLVISSKRLLRINGLEKSLRFVSLFPCLRNENEDRKSKAVEKMNLLLQSLIKENDVAEEPQKVASTQTKFKSRAINKEPKPKNLGQKIVEAAKEIAGKVEGKPEQIEVELLEKVLEKNENLRPTVLKAANNKTLSKLISEMKVEQGKDLKEDKAVKDVSFDRAGQVRSLLKDKSMHRSGVSFSEAFVEKFDLFSCQPLGIFKKELDSYKDEVKLKTWDHCDAKELRLSVSCPPSNIYEQMILWTDKGILWKFPIDNDQGRDEELKTSFSEHIFLETHLDDWCPKRGPIRHFMELVCVGLSRNHWLTVQEKKDHILWYRDYFLDKRKIIQEVGAGDFPLLEKPVAKSLSDK